MTFTERLARYRAHLHAERKIAEAATPGPWKADMSLIMTAGAEPEVCDCTGYDVDQQGANALAIIHAVNDRIPSIDRELAMLDALARIWKSNNWSATQTLAAADCITAILDTWEATR